MATANAAELAPVLIDGAWKAASGTSAFQAANPATGEKLPPEFPISDWADCELALEAASRAGRQLRETPAEVIAAFLETYAVRIESAAARIVDAAHRETGLPLTPRLRDVELPRTVDQLRQAAAAAREQSWQRATLDLARNIRSCYTAIGPVVVFGPNNFPLAFNGISGGDFAAAIAAGNPVLAKAHPLHPDTSRLLAEEARNASAEVGLPKGAVQMLYAVSNRDGLRLVGDPRVGAVAFTGSRAAGLQLKKAAEEAAKPIYLEMSSLNPVVFLPGVMAEDPERLAKELADSCLAAAGQFCTSPNLILVQEDAASASFLLHVANLFRERAPLPLLSLQGKEQMLAGIEALMHAGAQLVAGGVAIDGSGYRCANTLLQATGKQFLAAPHALQREVFGNAALAVAYSDPEELQSIVASLEGNLTAAIYSSKSGQDDLLYRRIEPLLRPKVGRLLNDKMPTGVAVSPAMQHGGPFPATAHPGFTSVGIPASLARFAALQCYDSVSQARLPPILRDTVSNPHIWRSIDGKWVQG